MTMGQVSVLEHTRAGKKDGPYIMWHVNGVKKQEGACKDGLVEGLVITWYKNGEKGLAKSAGVYYTRYADDLAFSGGGEFSRFAKSFAATVYTIILEEGFQPNFRKSRIMRAGVRQKIAGVIVNQHPNTSRATYDELKATIHRCRTQGIVARQEIDLDDHHFAGYFERSHFRTGASQSAKRCQVDGELRSDRMVNRRLQGFPQNCL